MLCTHTHIHTHVCVCVYIYICIYIYIYIYTNICTNKLVQLTPNRITGLFKSKEMNIRNFIWFNWRFLSKWGTKKAFGDTKALLHFVTNTLCFQPQQGYLENNTNLYFLIIQESLLDKISSVNLMSLVYFYCATRKFLIASICKNFCHPQIYNMQCYRKYECLSWIRTQKFRVQV